MNTHTLPRYRAIHVEFFSPTNTKGARVRVKDQRQGTTKFLPYNYAIGDIVEQASDYLTLCGIPTDGLALHDTQRGYTLLTSDFATSIKPLSLTQRNAQTL